MSDDDPTHRHRRAIRFQTSEDRDLAARRARSHPLVTSVQQPSPRQSQQLAVPVARDDEGDITSPFDLLERDPDREMRAIVERSSRNSEDPATFADVVKLAVALTKERSGNRVRERDAEEVLRAPRVAARSSRRYLIATVIAAAAGIATPIAENIVRPAATNGDAIRELLQKQDAAREQRWQQERAQYQHEIDRLDAELRAVREQLGRRSERQPNYLQPPDATMLSAISKGTAP